MGITLSEYRDILAGRKTLAQVEAGHSQVAQFVHPVGAGCAGGLELRLPYPPSLNRYYRTVDGRVLISRHGRNYRKQVVKQLKGVRTMCGKVEFAVDVYPPDNRRRDLDNLLKGLQDALVHAGALADDSQIKRLRMEMHAPERPDGFVSVRISRYTDDI